MNQNELNVILEQHKLWLNTGGVDGNKADLSGAYLRGVDFDGADLSEADLREAYLRGAYLSGAYLIGTDLRGADLIGTDLRGAYLEDAYLEGANLEGANLEGVYLYKANLSNADLENANLIGTDLRLANGIYSFGPVGNEKRIGYAVKHTDCVMIQLGCFWGTSDEAVLAVSKKYDKNSNYVKQIKLAVDILQGE